MSLTGREKLDKQSCLWYYWKNCLSGGTIMDRQWKQRIPVLCAALGAVMLVICSAVCMKLEQGGWLDRTGVALVLVIFAVVSLALLWLEGFRRDTLMVMLLPIGAAMLARALCMDYMSGDYDIFLSHWYDFFQVNNGFAAFSYSVGNYNVPYLYFIAIISYFKVPDLYLYKLFSILFDVVLAWGCLRLTRSLIRERKRSGAPLVAFGVALFLPTVVLNGAYWAQCDVIYGALCIHAAVFLLEGRNKTSVALMAVAFSFKLQAVFILPLWGVLWLAKKVKFGELWVFPLVYFATIVPALLMGKPLKDILSIYLGQMSSGSYLVLNAPAVYQFVPRYIRQGLADGTIEGSGLAAALGVAAAGLLVLALLALGFLLRDRLDRETAMAAAVVLCIGVPFLLPYMHERYFFLGDVFTLCWASADRRRVPVAVLVEGASLASYIVYFRAKYNFVLTLGRVQFGMFFETLMMLAALLMAVWALINEAKKSRGGIAI